MRKVCTDSLLARAHTSCHAARQYAANYGNVTSHSKHGDTPEAVDLGWRMPEKQKRGKKKNTVAKTVDATDDTDASERREAAKVCLPCLSA